MFGKMKLLVRLQLALKTARKLVCVCVCESRQGQIDTEKLLQYLFQEFPNVITVYSRAFFSNLILCFCLYI